MNNQWNQLDEAKIKILNGHSVVKALACGRSGITQKELLEGFMTSSDDSPELVRRKLNRILAAGVENGFITKHGNKYALPSFRNVYYAVDCDDDNDDDDEWTTIDEEEEPGDHDCTLVGGRSPSTSPVSMSTFSPHAECTSTPHSTDPEMFECSEGSATLTNPRTPRSDSCPPAGRSSKRKLCDTATAGSAMPPSKVGRLSVTRGVTRGVTRSVTRGGTRRGARRGIGTEAETTVRRSSRKSVPPKRYGF